MIGATAPNLVSGGVSEWPMVSDSKSDVRKYRGFKSLLLRNFKRPDDLRAPFIGTQVPNPLSMEK